MRVQWTNQVTTESVRGEGLLLMSGRGHSGSRRKASCTPRGFFATLKHLDLKGNWTMSVAQRIQTAVVACTLTAIGTLLLATPTAGTVVSVSRNTADVGTLDVTWGS